MSSKTLSFTLTLLLMLPFSAATAKSQYPLIERLHGKVWITGADNKKKPAKNRESLQTRALIQTEEGSLVQLRWDEKRLLLLPENSEILIPAISYDSGEAPLIVLKRGAVHWQALKVDAYKVAFRSDLFEFLAPAADFMILFDPAKAYAEVQVFEGRLEFSALNGEQSVLVQSHQKAGFQGALEEGRIAYDILLKGKKIPRGQLTPVHALAKEDRGLLTKAEEIHKKDIAAEKAKAQKAAERKQTSGEICHGPAAPFNECAWVCRGNPKKEKKICYLSDPNVRCVRQRCDANGEWSDVTELEGEKAQSLCKAEPRVGPCDY